MRERISYKQRNMCTTFSLCCYCTQIKKNRHSAGKTSELNSPQLFCIFRVCIIFLLAQQCGRYAPLDCLGKPNVNQNRTTKYHYDNCVLSVTLALR